MHTCPWRIHYYYIGGAVGLNELLGEHVFHIPCKELAIVYAIGFCVNLRILYGFRDIFNAYDLRSL